MPALSIRHLTIYRYRRPVAFGEHRMMFRPLESHDQRVLSAELDISPDPSLVRHIHDVGGLPVGVVRFEARSERLVFDSLVRLVHTPQAPLDLEDPDAVLHVGAPFAYGPEEAGELAASILRRPYDATGSVEAWARRFVRPAGGTPVSSVLTAMTHAIREEFAYALRLDGPPRAPAQTLAERQGACRDFAVLMIDAARSLGLAARFVSGYVYSTSGKSGRRGGGHTHAWVRAYVPGCGWTDFDPTNGIIGSADLIRTAVVTDPRLAVPLYGSYAGDAEDYLGMDVEVEVRPEPEPAVKPAIHLRVAHGR